MLPLLNPRSREEDPVIDQRMAAAFLIKGWEAVSPHALDEAWWTSDETIENILNSLSNSEGGAKKFLEIERNLPNANDL